MEFIRKVISSTQQRIVCSYGLVVMLIKCCKYIELSKAKFKMQYSQ